MIQKKELEFKKPIILDTDRMTELNAIICKYSGKVSYKITTIEKAQIEFDTFEQLMAYSNFSKERITELSIIGQIWDDRFIVYIDIRIQSESTFNRCVKCSYQFADIEKAKLFEIDLVNLLNRSVESYGSRIGFRLILTFALFAACVFSCIFLFRSKLHPYIQSIILFVLGAMLSPGYFLIKKLTDKVFPRVTFVWGEEAKRYNKYSKIKTNLFWCVLVATIIAIGTGILLSIIL